MTKRQITKPVSITVSAPGKIHFMGEHAVVHGKPAILAAINRRCRVTITLEDSPEITVGSKNLKLSETRTIDELLKKTVAARKHWQEFEKTNNAELLKLITPGDLDLAQIAIIETFAYYQKQFKSGFRLVIDSEVPVGARLGSSATLAVSIVTAITALLQLPMDKAVINDIAYIAEQRKHGFPSGGDIAVAVHGGLVWFRKESELLRMMGPISFEIPKTITKHFILIDTGRPEESTGELISIVKNLETIFPDVLDHFLIDQEAITRQLLSVLKSGDSIQLKQLIQQGERNLESIGVVSDLAKTLIRDIEASGGAAKIMGGGGRAKGVGMVLAYHPQLIKAKNIAQKLHLSWFQTELGVEGVRVEK